MQTKEVIVDLLSIPRRFNELSTVSVYDLLKQTNYSIIRDQISLKDIHASLAQHPEYVNDWLQYSEDKRCPG